MNRINTLALAIMGICALLFASCQKAPFVTMNGPRSYTFTDQGGKQSFSFSCNRDWRVSSSDSWIHVSPSSGTASDGEITVTVTCDANTTYDPRKTTLTLKVEELTETIEISQETNLGIIVSPKSYDLSSQAQAVEIEVQANVGYKISIDTSCKDWISEASTKGLTPTKHVFNIAENTTYDNREGKIYVRQEGSDVAETITIKQSQVEAIILNETNYSVECEGGVVKVPVKTNVDITVSIPTEAQSWIKHISTKGLSDQELSFEVEKYEGEDDRSAEITLSGGKASTTITILQKAAVSIEPIVFSDALVKKVCVEKFDKNGDGELSYKEASQVTSLGDDRFFGSYQNIVTSFDELQYFTNIQNLGSVFYDCNKLKSIVLPPYLTTISYSSFYNCSSLKAIVIPVNVTAIESGAFKYCTELETVTILGNLEKIGRNAFERCSKLHSINLPGTINSIEAAAFYLCESLTSIEIPEGITEIQESTFYSDSALQTVILPSTLEIIGDSAFWACGIKSINLPEGLISIGRCAFIYCSKLTEIHFPSSLVNISDIAFRGCTSLTSVEIPSSITVLNQAVFAGCSSLTSFTIPSSVTSIGTSFLEETGIQSIFVPSTVVEIGDNLFDRCVNLEKIEGPYASEDGRCLIVDSAIKGFAFKGLRNYTTPEGIKAIKCGMFQGSSEVETITFSEGVESIESSFIYGPMNSYDPSDPGYSIRECTLPSTLKQISHFGSIYHYFIMNCKAVEPPTAITGDIFAFSNYNYLIRVPTESVDKYRNAPGWSLGAKNGTLVGYDF